MITNKLRLKLIKILVNLLKILFLHLFFKI